jgi:peptidoglycan-associated lipoprotein
MKRSLLLNLLIAAALVLGGTVGCKRKPKSPTPIPARSGDMGGVNQYPPESPGATVIEPTPVVTGTEPDDEELGPDGGGELPPLGDWNVDPEHFAAYTVYFDFDRSTINVGEDVKIEAVGKDLINNPNLGVRIEGHCDERGTEGYNLALGERRALAIREYLVTMGVSGDRVDTVSYGESRPAALGNTEDAYAKNRRGEFMLLTPPPR